MPETARRSDCARIQEGLLRRLDPSEWRISKHHLRWGWRGRATSVRRHRPRM